MQKLTDCQKPIARHYDPEIWDGHKCICWPVWGDCWLSDNTHQQCKSNKAHYVIIRHRRPNSLRLWCHFFSVTVCLLNNQLQQKRSEEDTKYGTWITLVRIAFKAVLLWCSISIFPAQISWQVRAGWPCSTRTTSTTADTSTATASTSSMTPFLLDILPLRYLHYTAHAPLPITQVSKYFHVQYYKLTYTQREPKRTLETRSRT